MAQLIKSGLISYNYSDANSIFVADATTLFVGDLIKSLVNFTLTLVEWPTANSYEFLSIKKSKILILLFNFVKLCH